MDWSGFIGRQIKEALRGISASRISELVIAYEPVWTIGSGIPDTPEGALSASIFIRKTVAKLSGRLQLARDLRVIYGGSVTSKNIKSFVSQDGIDGALVGGASLDPLEFSKIVKIVAETSR